MLYEVITEPDPAGDHDRCDGVRRDHLAHLHGDHLLGLARLAPFDGRGAGRIAGLGLGLAAYSYNFV